MDGLDKFREAFAEYTDNYVVIGGTACSITINTPWYALALRTTLI